MVFWLCWVFCWCFGFCLVWSGFSVLPLLLCMPSFLHWLVHSAQTAVPRAKKKTHSFELQRCATWQRWLASVRSHPIIGVVNLFLLVTHKEPTTSSCTCVDKQQEAGTWTPLQMPWCETNLMKVLMKGWRQLRNPKEVLPEYAKRSLRSWLVGHLALWWVHWWRGSWRRLRQQPLPCEMSATSLADSSQQQRSRPEDNLDLRWLKMFSDRPEDNPDLR